MVVLSKLRKFLVNIGKIFVSVCSDFLNPKLSSELHVIFNIIVFSSSLSGEVRCTSNLETALKLYGLLADIIVVIFIKRFQFV